MAETAPAEKSTRKKAYAPTDEDYHIESIRIEEAENGVVVCCGYALNDDVRDRMDKDRSAGLYCDSYCEPEKHVFESKADAKAFIISELDALWAGENTDERQ